MFFRRNAEVLTAHGELCWGDIKAKTGFASYEEYLEAHESEYPSLAVIRTAIWHPHKDLESCLLRCSLFDLSQSADLSIGIRATEYHGDTSLHTTLLGDLHLPPSDVSLRVLLWWLDDSRLLTSRFLDVCGFGLAIDPGFFITLVDQAKRFATKGDRRFSMRSVQTSYTLVGNHILCVARDYIPSKTDTPPVLLVVGWNDEKIENNIIRSRSDFDNPRKVLDGIPPCARKSQERLEEAHWNCQDYRSRRYAEILSQLIERKRQTATGEQRLLILAMLPILQIDALHIQGRCRSVRRLQIELGPSSDSGRSTLSIERFWLRRHIEDAEASRTYFLRYLNSVGQIDITHDVEFRTAEEEWNDAIHEARSLDSEVFDNLQLIVGHSSLEESRKSIELSTSQIEESKRGKRLMLVSR